MINGFAAAPPGIGCKIGVSTSMKLSFSRVALMEEIILDLFKNVSLTLSLTIKSTYLCLYLSSGELNSSYTFPSLSVFGSGKGFNDFDNNLKSFTRIVISPTFVLNSSPSIPIISPISKSFLYKSLYFDLSSPKHISSLLK